MIRDITMSLLLTVFASSVIAATGYFVFDASPLKIGAGAFLIQIIGFYMWNTMLQVVVKNRLESEETERIKIYEQQGANVNCAYCGKPNFVPIRMNDENVFQCEHCDKPNSIYVDIVVAQKTEIIDKDRISISLYNQQKLDATEKLKN